MYRIVVLCFLVYFIFVLHSFTFILTLALVALFFCQNDPALLFTMFLL